MSAYVVTPIPGSSSWAVGKPKGGWIAQGMSERTARKIARLLNGEPPKTEKALQALLPDAAIEEVGERRELVIYTGLATATYDRDADEWTETRGGRLVPMDEFLY